VKFYLLSGSGAPLRAKNGSVPVHPSRDILNLTMRSLLATLGLVLLTACAGPQYYPATPAGEGGYYIAQTPPAVVHYEGGYDYGGFQSWGIYPWWGYTYYSPNFYPHYFSMGYPAWYGHYGWSGGPPYGFPPYGHPYRPFSPAVRDEPGAAVGFPSLPGHDAAPPAVRHQTQPAADIRDLYRYTADRDRHRVAPGDARAVRPNDPVTIPPTSSHSYGASGASPRSPVSGPTRTGAPGRLTPMVPARPAIRVSDRIRSADEP